MGSQTSFTELKKAIPKICSDRNVHTRAHAGHTYNLAHSFGGSEFSESWTPVEYLYINLMSLVLPQGFKEETPPPTPHHSVQNFIL